MAKRRTPLFWLGSALLVGFAAAAMFAPALAPHDPHFPTGRPLATPTTEHVLGTNDLGQDTLSQLIYGVRTTLTVAIGVAIISTSLSWLVGLTAGLVRRAEAPLMAVVDLHLALPDLPLFLLVLTLVGPSRWNIVLVLGLFSWPGFARIVRGVVYQTRSSPYVEASRAMGAPTVHVMRRHILPATLHVLPTKLVLTVRYAVFAEATLAFLGLNAGDSISWGQMLSWAFADPLLFARPVWPWLVFPPMLAIATLLLATVWTSTRFGSTPKRPRRVRLAMAKQHDGSVTMRKSNQASPNCASVRRQVPLAGGLIARGILVQRDFVTSRSTGPDDLLDV